MINYFSQDSLREVATDETHTVGKEGEEERKKKEKREQLLEKLFKKGGAVTHLCICLHTYNGPHDHYACQRGATQATSKLMWKIIKSSKHQ